MENKKTLANMVIRFGIIGDTLLVYLLRKNLWRHSFCKCYFLYLPFQFYLGLCGKTEK